MLISPYRSCHFFYFLHFSLAYQLYFLSIPCYYPVCINFYLHNHQTSFYSRSWPCTQPSINYLAEATCSFSISTLTYMIHLSIKDFFLPLLSCNKYLYALIFNFKSSSPSQTQDYNQYYLCFSIFSHSYFIHNEMLL